VFVIRSNDVTIERNAVVDTTFVGIFAFESYGVRIERNTSSRNGAGIAVTGSDGVRITRNVVSGNGFSGIVVESDGSRVDHNQIVDNGNGIIVFANHAMIADNNIDGAVGCLTISEEECVSPPLDCPDCSEGWGISVEGGAGSVVARNDVRRTVRDGIRVATFDTDTATVDTVVRDNHVRDAVLDGFAVGVDGEEPPRGTQVMGNEATGSGDDGFDVRSPLTTLTRNLAVRSGDLGIDAAPGVTDGGGNRARQSGDPAQCVGIRCR
jgi:parallel beta-helix repeat protein